MSIANRALNRRRWSLVAAALLMAADGISLTGPRARAESSAVEVCCNAPKPDADYLSEPQAWARLRILTQAPSESGRRRTSGR